MTTLLPTGNEYLAVPTIRESDAAIDSVNVVLSKLDGLLELVGSEAFPFLACSPMGEAGHELDWRLIEDWIPTFGVRGDAGGRRGVICAPPDQRFLIYSAPASARPVRFTLAIDQIVQTINVRHRLPSWTCRIAPFNWSYKHGVVIDIYTGELLLSVSLRCTGRGSYRCHANGDVHQLSADSPEVETSGAFRVEVDPADQAELLVGFGLSRVGARAADLEGARIPPAEWVERAEQWLADRALLVEGDPALSAKGNRNGHFARFFAMARALDTSEVVSMTSRSHRYYVSAAYWDRDSLLWLYPFLVRNDRDHALDLLRYAFGPQLRHAGIHSRQIGGQILEYGFELDELCAPLIALGTWEVLHREVSVWGEAPFREGAVELLRRLRSWRCADAALYRTELMPTDDPLVGGRDVLTYNNALVLHTLRLMLPFAEACAPSLVEWMRADAEAIPAAIDRHLVRNGIFQWSTDLNGSVEFYDEAAGSLLLLPYYGLCDPQSPTFLKTVSTLYSSDYEYRHPGPFSELGNRHTEVPHPWILSACNSVLSGVRRDVGLDFLRRAPMDGGIACESVSAESGLPETGMHFATCAGFVAHAIAHGTGSYREEILQRDAARNGAAAGTP